MSLTACLHNFWGRLPLHVLLERGGTGGVGAALAPDPAALLPLHVVFLRGEHAALALDQVAALDVARFFVEARPRALQARDRQGRLPLHAWALNPWWVSLRPAYVIASLLGLSGLANVA
jgi:hypothetical protein